LSGIQTIVNDIAENQNRTQEPEAVKAVRVQEPKVISFQDSAIKQKKA
jgi:hypothetical protein